MFAGDEVFPDEITSGPIPGGDDSVRDEEPCRHLLDANGVCKKCHEDFGPEVFKS